MGAYVLARCLCVDVVVSGLNGQMTLRSYTRIAPPSLMQHLPLPPPPPENAPHTAQLCQNEGTYAWRNAPAHLMEAELCVKRGSAVGGCRERGDSLHEKRR